MQHTKTVDLGDRQIEIRELTVGELRKMLRDSREEISGMTFEDLVLRGRESQEHSAPMYSI